MGSKPGAVLTTVDMKPETSCCVGVVRAGLAGFPADIMGAAGRKRAGGGPASAWLRADS